MIRSADIEAVIPVSNIETAMQFYEEKLGLEILERSEALPENPEVRFSAGGRGGLTIYQSPEAGKSGATLAGLTVDDLDATLAELRERGVTPEDYDLPGIKTQNGIAELPHERAAWVKDPDGNTIAILSRTS